jgi:hypothetical protein
MDSEGLTESSKNHTLLSRAQPITTKMELIISALFESLTWKIENLHSWSLKIKMCQVTARKLSIYTTIINKNYQNTQKYV